MKFTVKLNSVGKEVPELSKNLRIAGILDELSERFFPFECQFVNLDCNQWKKQIESQEPHILFVESVWNGYKKTWRGKFSHSNNLQLRELVNWCNAHHVPTVFWNKEDPIHMFTFLGVASLFDYVFTTDLDCVPLYKRLLGHDRVGVLPFATAIQLFNPIEKYDRKDAACFAGSFYAKRIERRDDFIQIADSLMSSYDLEIYDRNPYPGNPDYTFPNRFQPLIKGSLPVNEIDIAYKGYKIGVTLNIVKHSSTMEARRVFELLGSNTLTVSNPCLGIKNLFGDLVIQDEKKEEFLRKISEIAKDENFANRVRLLALRKILQQHTYKERVSYLYEKCFNASPKNVEPEVTAFSVVTSLEEVDYIKERFNQQTYSSKVLLLFTANRDLVHNDSYYATYPVEDLHSTLTEKSDYYSFLSVNNYYGKNYLLDLMLAQDYATVSAVGKSAHFKQLEDKTTYLEELGTYRLIDRLQIDRCVFSRHLLPLVNQEILAISNWNFEGIPCLSIDIYNFCENVRADSLPDVDDLNIESGICIKDLYRISDHLSPKHKNYCEGFQLTGDELIKSTIFENSKMQIYPHPLNYFTFFTKTKGEHRIWLGKNITIKELTTLDELTDKAVLNVFLNGVVEGEIQFYTRFYTDSQDYISGYLVNINSCTTIPVPKSAAYCQLLIIVQDKAYCLVKEVLFGPFIKRPINLLKDYYEFVP